MCCKCVSFLVDRTNSKRWKLVRCVIWLALYISLLCQSSITPRSIRCKATSILQFLFLFQGLSRLYWWRGCGANITRVGLAAASRPVDFMHDQAVLATWSLWSIHQQSCQPTSLSCSCVSCSSNLTQSRRWLLLVHRFKHFLAPFEISFFVERSHHLSLVKDSIAQYRISHSLTTLWDTSLIWWTTLHSINLKDEVM